MLYITYIGSVRGLESVEKWWPSFAPFQGCKTYFGWLILNCPHGSKLIWICHSPWLIFHDIQMKIVLNSTQWLEISFNSLSSHVYGPCTYITNYGICTSICWCMWYIVHYENINVQLLNYYCFLAAPLHSLLINLHSLHWTTPTTAIWEICTSGVDVYGCIYI